MRSRRSPGGSLLEGRIHIEMHARCIYRGEQLHQARLHRFQPLDRTMRETRGRCDHARWHADHHGIERARRTHTYRPGWHYEGVNTYEWLSVFYEWDDPVTWAY